MKITITIHTVLDDEDVANEALLAVHGAVMDKLSDMIRSGDHFDPVVGNGELGTYNGSFQFTIN